MKKRIFTLAPAVLLSVGSAFAQSDIYGVFNRIGMNAGVSTEGITVGIATPITPYLELGFDANFMPGFKVDGDVKIDGGTIIIPKPGGSDTYTLDKVKLEGKFNRTTFNARLSVYPFGERAAFFIAGGLSFGGEKIAKLSGHNDEVARLYREHPEYADLITAEVGKYEIVIDREGNVEGDVRVKSVRPYVGLGYGRLVPKNRIGFRVEAGCQFMGKMKVYQNGVEMPDILSKAADDDLSKIIDKWSVYPVLRLTITGRIL
jgi:hypothetical protein